jgi:hypothetical protein
MNPNIQLLWKRKAPSSGPKSNLKEKNGRFPYGWIVVLFFAGWAAAVSRAEWLLSGPYDLVQKERKREKRKEKNCLWSRGFRSFPGWTTTQVNTTQLS